MKRKVLGIITASVVAVFMTGCADKVRIQALNPAEVGEMASKKKVAITDFKNDTVGLSGQIESQIAKQKLDKKRYFTVLSRKDLASVMKEQKLQSSELLDATTASKVGALVGAQALVNGEISSAQAESGSYVENKKECLSYYKGGGCAQWRFYKVTCKTTQATVAANINIVSVKDGSIIYADNYTKNYSGDSCKAGRRSLGLLVVDSGPKTILSEKQAINKLAADIANEFVYKLSPHYIYFNVALLDSIEIETEDKHHETLERSIEFIKAGRMDKADKMLNQLMTDVDGKCHTIAYVYGVVKEARGQFDEAKELYTIADDLSTEPVAEINLAVTRIDRLISKRDEARKQMNTES